MNNKTTTETREALEKIMNDNASMATVDDYEIIDAEKITDEVIQLIAKEKQDLLESCIDVIKRYDVHFSNSVFEELKNELRALESKIRE